MKLRDTVEIAAPPERVFTFFARMDENYTRWHPDHLLFEWKEGSGLRPGVRFYFEERIGGKLLKKTVVFTRVERDRYIEFAPTMRLIRLIMPRLLFRLVPVGSGTRFEAEIHIRTGPLGAWLNRREFDAVRQHMREEGENLKRLVEEEQRSA